MDETLGTSGTSGVATDLERQSVRGGVATVAAQGTRLAIQLATTMVLARALSPHDYGLIAMVTAVVGFFGMFVDPGLAAAAVQRPGLSLQMVSALFWIHAGIGLAILGVTAAVAPLIAWFYDEPRLLPITFVLSLAFLLQSLGVQHHALLRRAMRFTALGAIDVCSILTGSLIGVSLAFAGGQYWALVAIPLVSSLFSTMLLWRTSAFVPGRPAPASEIRSILRFGRDVTAFNALNYLARNLDNVLVGRYWGAHALGAYSRAYQLLLLPLTQISSPVAQVTTSALSSLQGDPERYRRYYLRALTAVAAATFPIIATLFALADELVAVVLGDQWTRVGPLFRILAVAALFQPVLHSTAWIYLSRGDTRSMVVWGWISVPSIVTSFLIGLPWGAEGVALAYAVCVNLLVVPGVLCAIRGSPIRLADVVDALHRPFLASAGACGIMIGTKQVLATQPPFVAVTSALLATFLALAGCLLVWPGLRDSAREIVVLLRHLRPKQTIS